MLPEEHQDSVSANIHFDSNEKDTYSCIEKEFASNRTQDYPVSDSISGKPSCNDPDHTAFPVYQILLPELQIEKSTTR